MSQVFSHHIGFPTKLQLLYRDDNLGVAGLATRVSLRDGINNKYLDFADNLWKMSGWTQKYLALSDFGNGIYQYTWNSWLSVKSTTVIVAEYEVTTAGYESFDADVLVFGLTEMVETGRWKMINDQMIFYGPDGTTPILTFNLFDIDGAPTMDAVTERQRV